MSDLPAAFFPSAFESHNFKCFVDACVGAYSWAALVCQFNILSEAHSVLLNVSS